ncbi:MAG: hypothetical protein OdinLCB4_003445 [Candidatus Odinarchaeum yellowstonii]|jgi:sporulation protein YlmC with PRC-barrel domain|uniref:Uncharacterized protein n=1 Tax=Odinarchaeota yellowstonii (strain LCB_4) TaxID=1841599 RepID=A0AAF0IBQ2_ODILC|nr:MAG: hypothetical protein OdinLCB4_003445 [Candidatus Odinarchaeum yellowstonii]
MDVEKILRLKIMSADFKEVGKVKSLEVQNWSIVGIRAELSKELTTRFFGKSAFRLTGEETFLLVKLVKNIGDVIILNITGPDLMVYSKLGQIFVNGRDVVKKEVISVKDIDKFSKKIDEQIAVFLKEVEELPSVSEQTRASISGDSSIIRELLINSAYEKLGLTAKKE